MVKARRPNQREGLASFMAQVLSNSCSGNLANVPDEGLIEI